MGGPRIIYWFRTDLRLHDSPALKAALDLDPVVLWPIFTWDPHYVYRVKGGANRWQYLLDCQTDLSESISKLNKKSKLFVLREAPQTLFPKLFKAWKVTHLVFENDTDPYALERDKSVVALAEKAGVQVISPYGRTLWDSDDVVAKNGGKPTMSITQLQAAGRKVGEIPRPIPAPTHLPDPGDMPIDFEQSKPETKPDLNASYRGKADGTYSNIAGPKGDFAIATLEELGFSVPATTPHRGGESIALKRLEEIFSDEEYAATFQKPKTSPAAFEPQSTTLLSPMLHFGALSPRLFYWKAQDLVERYGKGASTPPESLTGQLLFRDMYFAAQAAIGPPFGQTVDNAYCRFIPWHLPSKIGVTDIGDCTISGEYYIDSPQAEKWFQRWKVGMTGFPFVDALMRQLRTEGWIHHLGRHMVACFLTRGGCYVHWERGADVFEELLIDHEPSCNAGNWQWLSCTAFYSQYFRCYSPVAFGQKWDKKGELIRKWIPELKNLDEKFIYEPWKATKAALDKAGVKIEGDGINEKTDGTYPARMFDFGERRGICIAAMKRAYSIGLHGNDDRVKNGSWKKLFEEAGETEMEGLGGSDDDGEHADDADYQREGDGNHGKHARTQSTGSKEGPMDKYTKKVKR
ncbi:Cryptochrome/photolyase FAD-binding domain-containing protein [Annulohypoxylon maeteangense]|uniref:Cryptochrome/photolyase FAD-binding domain-containing protein n=1 Tax=Annulohypoxylon maeteangense TaxID=1927788 RepID=UPI0020077AEE|nr:Cryptochrome/photolyase FAD-binding domain-containing protein [Annulohypoxylon maeteangense]KAI0881912.1 Cryptochrome/photolyase FAD-binding domain-containing protein [Annulohypoxylon maeteangense]